MRTERERVQGTLKTSQPCNFKFDLICQVITHLKWYNQALCQVNPDKPRNHGSKQKYCKSRMNTSTDDTSIQIFLNLIYNIEFYKLSLKQINRLQHTSEFK